MKARILLVAVLVLAIVAAFVGGAAAADSQFLTRLSVRADQVKLVPIHARQAVNGSLFANADAENRLSWRGIDGTIYGIELHCGFSIPDCSGQ